jgi:CAAX protease family protein
MPDAISPAPPRSTPRGRLSEPLVVLGTYFLLTGLSAIGYLLRPDRRDLILTDRVLWGGLAVEVLFMVAFVPWLVRRGWNLARITHTFTPRDLLRSVPLLVYFYLAYFGSFFVFSAIDPVGARQMADDRQVGDVSAGVVLLISLLNPVFEEFLLLAYTFNAFEHRISWLPWAISLTLRVGSHAYQGMGALVSILPLGIVLTAYYVGTRRIWPVVIAHAALDLVGLAWPS